MKAAERFCCDGNCIQGRDCPLNPRREPGRPSTFDRLCFALGWLLLLALFTAGSWAPVFFERLPP